MEAICNMKQASLMTEEEREQLKAKHEFLPEINTYNGKRWRDMSSAETNKYKSEVCRKKCDYFTRSASYGPDSRICEYLDRTGSCRRCSPLDCKDYGYFKPKQGAVKAKRMPRLIL